MSDGVAGTFAVPFGDGTIRFTLPAGLRGAVATGHPPAPLADASASADAAVATPLGAPRLRELARGKRRVCIAVTDATRACPDHVLVPPMLAELQAAGVPDDAITILVAVGTHRASTDKEKQDKLGAETAERYRVVDHDAADDAGLVRVTEGPGGIPFRLNRIVAEADLLLSTGLVEPHQYAGYSGGGKTIAIGCADEATIAYTHGPAMLDRPGTRLARLDGNPFQEAVRRVARAARLAFVGNAVLDENGRAVAISYGASEAVQDHLASVAGPFFTARIPAQVDIAVAGVGAPKDANLYQASRAASYLQFAPTPVVRRGGVVIVPAACPEGAGEGAGERRFFAAMSEAGDPAAIIERVRRDGIRPGEQRAYIMALVLADVSVVVAGIEDPEVARSVGFLPAGNIEESLVTAAAIVGTPASVLVVPHALQTLPIVENALPGEAV
ncbi:MAG: Transcriptional regulator [uncultured Thermomicrobiales bacterium]|uniref:Transcriptional regulator n=1 Tax=uncultured Thermomicrobiales bacterium TaxID=1645740 RepID=A0A6J4UKN9_9BACT|nr:MAG: Transcriptional regulator [uncultured Thermomicrobiales bacterium]